MDKNESMKISVIVPVYKVEKYLDRCIQSIVDQTYRNLEIFLVDDGSPDDCPQMCDAWATQDKRIRVIHQENGGLAAVRNTGLDAATGDLICFVDSDDAIVPTLCEKVIEAFCTNNVEIVAFNCQRITEAGALLGGTEKLITGVLNREDALTQLICGNMNDYLWSKVYRASVFDGVRFIKKRACFEDTDVTYRLILNAEHIYCMDEQLYFYYQRSDSASASMTAAKVSDLYQVRLERYRVLQGIYPQIAEQALLRLARAALYLYDRSLWEDADESIVEDARCFLADNRKSVLATDRSMNIRMYYFMPYAYQYVRRAKHFAGNLVKRLKRKMKQCG